MFSYTASFDGPGSRCPADFMGASYAKGVQLERSQAAVTLTAAVFSPCGGYLVCASDSGRIGVWELSAYMDREAFSGGEPPDITPHLSFQADRSCINCLTFAGDLLLCGGDESMFGWRWAWVVSSLEGMTTTPPPPECSWKEGTALRVRCPQVRGRRGALLPYPEINDIVFDKMSGRVVCAAGDGNAYEWDIGVLASTLSGGGSGGGGGGGRRKGKKGERGEGAVPLRTYEGRQGYLHAVATAPGSSLIATGSDDGVVGLWDRRAKNGAEGGANAAFLRPAHAKQGDGHEVSPEGRGSDGGAWVSSLEMDDGGHTLVCGGGRGVPAAFSEEACEGRGWVNQWNLAASTATSVSSFPTEVQCMESTEEGRTLLIAGAEPSVTYLSRSRLEKRVRTPTTCSSIYALAVNGNGPHEGITCVAGVGPTIDIYTLPGIISFSLCFV